MKFNKLKATAATFVIAGSVVFFVNDMNYSGTVLTLKVIGACVFLYAIRKDLKLKKG
ncbi:MAG: hypothetical protein AB8B52_00920 [Winogradskyella sp.]|uniref:hypothetical protein n=1 Tax=Winogradskyella sp. TaxID=1883156 RepID=UPI00385FB80A